MTFPTPRVLALVVALTVVGVTASPAHAAAAANAQQAAQVALQQSGGGKVLGVSTETDGSGKRVFAVKVLSNGRIRVVRVPQG